MTRSPDRKDIQNPRERAASGGEEPRKYNLTKMFFSKPRVTEQRETGGTIVLTPLQRTKLSAVTRDTLLMNAVRLLAEGDISQLMPPATDREFRAPLVRLKASMGGIDRFLQHPDLLRDGHAFDDAEFPRHWLKDASNALKAIHDFVAQSNQDLAEALEASTAEQRNTLVDDLPENLQELIMHYNAIEEVRHGLQNALPKPAVITRSKTAFIVLLEEDSQAFDFPYWKAFTYETAKLPKAPALDENIAKIQQLTAALHPDIQDGVRRTPKKHIACDSIPDPDAVAAYRQDLRRSFLTAIGTQFPAIAERFNLTPESDAPVSTIASIIDHNAIYQNDAIYHAKAYLPEQDPHANGHDPHFIIKDIKTPEFNRLRTLLAGFIRLESIFDTWETGLDRLHKRAERAQQSATATWKR